jgi:tetratricopeptide (TPR) repeat protein
MKRSRCTSACCRSAARRTESGIPSSRTGWAASPTRSDGDRQKYDDARTTIERAIEIAVEAVGPRHPDVGRFRYERALLLADSGRLQDALRENAEATAIVQEGLGRDHTAVAELFEATARWEEALGHTRAAREARDRADAIRMAVGAEPQ